MVALPEADARVVRAWSVVVTRGMLGTPHEVAKYLSADVEDTTRRMAYLRSVDQLPRQTLLAPVAS